MADDQLVRHRPVALPYFIVTGFEAINYIGNLAQRGIIAAERANYIVNQLQQMGERGRYITSEVRSTVNNMLQRYNELYEQGRREIEGPRERARAHRATLNEIDERHRAIQAQNTNRRVETNAPREAPQPIATQAGQQTLDEWRNQNTRRNPATTSPETPNPTPTPAVAQPSTSK